MKPIQNPLHLAPLLTIILSTQMVQAATMTASPDAPPALGEDIANYASVTGTDKWFAENNTGAGSAKGQTFTTGSVEVLLKSITYQVTSTQKAEPTKTYVIRVGTVSGTTFTQIHSETATQTFTWNGGEYMTWTLDTPVLLSANTTYGIDVGMTNSTSSWQTGIPYLNLTANAYAGGVRYSSGQYGVGTDTMSLVSNGDRIFHIALQHPLAPSPANGAEVPAGDLTLSWTNLEPNTGTDVWVDVWFGTDPGNLTKVADAQQNLTSFQVNLPGADTYYWRIDSYLDGAPTGTPVQSTLFSFFVFDSDGDGFPDEYELLHTDPPSATALNREDDLENDGAGDGLTAWEEYQLGTSPSLADTDGDGLEDGPETVGVGLRPATDPTLFDTDGDGLSDSVESNSGTWVGTADTGTNPTLADTDADALSDGVETNTGTLVDATNTGTNPLLSDTDGDLAGDWYEIAASFTNPFSAASKPDLPYPLPDPDTSTGATDKPVRVYIMSGQSNMVGFGTRDGTDEKTLQSMTLRQNKFPDLIDETDAWTTRQDVRYRGVISDTGKVQLSPGTLGSTFGPELGFGYVMGWQHDEPVLLLKTSIGNRSLGWDVLPPGSVSYEYDGYQYAGYGQSPLKWLPESGPSPFVWYAGKQYDDYFLDEADMGAPTWADATDYPKDCQVTHNGTIYISKSAHLSSAGSEPGVGPDSATFWNAYSIFNATNVLDNFATEYPDWASQGFEIAGFVWWQGDKDRYDLGHATRYEQNLVSLINSLRGYYTNRYPGKVVNNAPFVLATLGQTPLDSTNTAERAILDAQLAVDGESGNYPSFAGNVKTVYAHPLSQGGASNSHYNGHAQTYMLVGDALGRAMVELQGNVTPPGDNTFADWIAGKPGVNGQTGVDQDPDGDGIDNGVENFFGTEPGVFSQGMVAGAASGNTFTFTHPQGTLADDLVAAYRWSTDLASFHGHGEANAGTTVNFTTEANTPETGMTTVTATVTGTPVARLFVMVEVTSE